MVMGSDGGQGRIRTFVPRKEGQIYSLLALTTHPPVRSDFQSITRILSPLSRRSSLNAQRIAMRRNELGILFLFACGVASLAASNTAWLNKEYKDWTDKDAQAVMTDSPWAKQMPLPASARPGVMVLETGSSAAAPPAASLGNSANTTTG